MRFFLIILFIFLVNSEAYAQKRQSFQQNNKRVTESLNSEWTFNYFPGARASENYASFGFDDSRWSVISLPHTWRTWETTGEDDPYFPLKAEDDNLYWWTGWGWYRKRFSLEKQYFGRKVFLEFGGVQKNCKVWLNGKLIGEHKGSNTTFDFDITALVKPEGSDNVLVVAVNNFQEGSSPFITDPGGNYLEYGGMTRDVRIILKDQLHIPMQGSASHEGGTFIKTPVANEKEAVVHVQTWVKNDYAVKKNCTLKSTILDSYNKAVQVVTSQAEINPGQLFMFDQTFKPVRAPKLWSPENPYLYVLKSEVIDGNSVVDNINTDFGIRSIAWDSPTKSVTLNGKKINLKGGNRQQDFPWIGAAVPAWLVEAEMKKIAEDKKINFIRTIHSIDNRVVYEQADKTGILIDAELLGLPDKQSDKLMVEQKVTGIFRSLRNNPSVIFWSVNGDNSLASAAGKILAADPSRPLLEERTGNNAKLPLYGAEEALSPESGKAARLILRASHGSISADRGSVVFLTVSAVDNEGRVVNLQNSNLKWKVSGPAAFAGPPDYVADEMLAAGNGAGHRDRLPGFNIIRSAGTPGKIEVSVFSSGIMSGNVSIEARQEAKGISVIREYPLSGEGRKPVSRLIINLSSLDEVPDEIKDIDQPLDTGIDDRQNTIKKLNEYIFERNPSTDTSSVEFRALVSVIAGQILNNGGTMPAADYNYNADHYNNCRLIYSYIMATKLPPLFKETLRKYYARSIIVLGTEKNAGEEMNWLNWIPSGGQVVVVKNENTVAGIKNVVYTGSTDLPEIISEIYPQFSGLSEYGVERALTFIYKMNPYIDALNDQGKITYKARPGEMILIPLYKFISE